MWTGTCQVRGNCQPKSKMFYQSEWSDTILNVKVIKMLLWNLLIRHLLKACKVTCTCIIGHSDEKKRIGHSGMFDLVTLCNMLNSGINRTPSAGYEHSLKPARVNNFKGKIIWKQCYIKLIFIEPFDGNTYQITVNRYLDRCWRKASHLQMIRVVVDFNIYSLHVHSGDYVMKM